MAIIAIYIRWIDYYGYNTDFSQIARLKKNLFLSFILKIYVKLDIFQDILKYLKLASLTILLAYPSSCKNCIQNHNFDVVIK